METRFKSLKSSRHLEWQNHLGLVDLTLTFEHRESVQLTVPPATATVVMAFMDEQDGTMGKTMDLGELAEKTGMKNEQELKKRLAFLVKRRIICEVEPETFQVLERLDDTNLLDNGFEGRMRRRRRRRSGSSLSSSSSSDEEMAAGYDVSGGMMDEKNGATNSKMQLYLSFITGMLTNLGPLPMERIQMMLGMFVQGPEPYSETLEDLVEFLNQLVSEEKLDFQDGLFSMRK